MVKLQALGVLLLAGMVLGCSVSRPAAKKPASQTHRYSSRAVNYYLAGALYDFQYLYKEALVEYYNALGQDSTSAQILKAIGRTLVRLEQYEKAVQYLERSLQVNPRDRETLYYLAEVHFKLKNTEKSLLYYERLLDLDPYNATAQANLIYIYTRSGQTDKLISLRERLIDIYGYEEDSVYQLLSLYMQTRQLERAGKLIRSLLNEYPREPAHWMIYGNLLEMQSDTSAAINAYKMALELDPQNSQALTQIYQLYFYQRDWPGMVSTFGNIVSKNASGERARLFLAEGYFYLEDLPKARETLAPLLNKGDFRAHALLLMGRIAVSENLLDEARQHFRDLLAVDPRNSRAWEYLAVLHYQDRQYRECVEVLTEALLHFPDETRLLSLYGNALQQMGKLSDALVPLRRAYALDSGDINTIVALAVVYDELQMYSALDSLYQAALERYPENALLLNNYGYSLAERGIQLERALAMARAALGQDPDNAAYLDTMGWIYYQMGDYRKALEFIRRAVSGAEQSAEVLEHLGDVYLKLGQEEDARLYWQKALERDPGNETLKNKLRQDASDSQ